jgi:hypothetical protein
MTPSHVRSRTLTNIALSNKYIKTCQFTLLTKSPSYEIILKAWTNFIGQFFGSNFLRAIQRGMVCPGQNHFKNYQAGRFPLNKPVFCRVHQLTKLSKYFSKKIHQRGPFPNYSQPYFKSEICILTRNSPTFNFCFNFQVWIILRLAIRMESNFHQQVSVCHPLCDLSFPYVWPCSLIKITLLTVNFSLKTSKVWGFKRMYLCFEKNIFLYYCNYSSIRA